MPYKVFISHSNYPEDLRLVNQLKIALSNAGFIPLIAEEQTPDTTPTTLPDHITSMINESDFAIILLTEHGVASTFVNTEVGYVLHRKPLIPLVAQGIESQRLNLLQGALYIKIEVDSADTLNNCLTWLNNLRAQNEIQQRQQRELAEMHRSQQANNDALGAIALIGVGALAAYFLTRRR